MIALIIKSYISILLSVGLAALFTFISGVYFIFKKPVKKSFSLSVQLDSLPPETPVDLSAIAGDDLITTQLDLARAYIETGKPQSAKAILAAVVSQGSMQQQEEAQHLLASIVSG